MLGATAGNLSSAAAGPLSVSPAAATQLVLTAQPPGIVTAGIGFGVSVAAEDPFGNVVTSFQGPVTAILSGVPGSGVLGGTPPRWPSTAWRSSPDSRSPPPRTATGCN